jgi:glutamyl-tRNA synthetase
MALEEGLRRREAGYVGRFAPSPTGPLHLGNLRTAFLSWLGARAAGGLWLLRLDDLDTPRNRAGAEASLLEDLAWLGLAPDRPPIRQSDRRGLYASVLSALRRSGRLYPCRCSRRMLMDLSAPHGRSPVYPGLCRHRPRRWGAEEGRLPSWRLRLPDGPLEWHEMLGPPGRLDAAAEVGDVVLRRADGFIAYHLATAVDELLLGIGEVLRGEDLWASTAAQVAVMRVLGAPPPRYGHLPLWRDREGRRLAKRQGAAGLAPFRERGDPPERVIGLMAASVGLVPPGSCLSAAEAAGELRGRSPAVLLAGEGRSPSQKLRDPGRCGGTDLPESVSRSTSVPHDRLQ